MVSSHVCVPAQSCLTLCEPVECSPPGSSVHGIFPGKNTGVGCYFSLQEIFRTQGSNLSPVSVGEFFTTEPPGKTTSHRECTELHA